MSDVKWSHALFAVVAGAAFACIPLSCTSPNDSFCPSLMSESCDDGIDNDCDGLVDYDDLDDCRIVCGEDCPPRCDADGDGALAQGCGGNDCNDHSDTVYPGHPEICTDGLDNNCDGIVDSQDVKCQNTCDAAGPVSIEVGLEGVDTVLACSSFCGPPGAGWGLFDAAGHLLPFKANCGDVLCDSCQESPCPGMACQMPQVRSISSPLRFQWDGKVMEQSTCGAGTICAQRGCAPPGGYTAKVCAYVAKPGLVVEETCDEWDVVCTEIGFDYPTATVIRGKLVVPLHRQ
jgi:hypothetical protein